MTRQRGWRKALQVGRQVGGLEVGGVAGVERGRRAGSQPDGAAGLRTDVLCTLRFVKSIRGHQSF